MSSTLFVAMPLIKRDNTRDPLQIVENQHIQLPNTPNFVQAIT